jgi:hypothetical protein
MLRLVLKHGNLRDARLLEAPELVKEIQGFQRGGFADAPGGPVVVEALDAGGRVLWQAHYSSFSKLVGLIGELGVESIASR